MSATSTAERAPWYQSAFAHYQHLQPFEASGVSLSRIRLNRSRAEVGIEALRSHGRAVPNGEYWQLRVHGELVMSDTPDEISDLLSIPREVSAGGDALITGLGLGCAAALAASGAGRVTVIERETIICEKVGAALTATFGDRIEIINADAFTWKPPSGRRWAWAWHDIWPNICADNLGEMGRLRRHYGRRIDRWQGCWAEWQCKRHR